MRYVLTWLSQRWETEDAAALDDMLTALEADPEVERYTLATYDNGEQVSWVTGLAEAGNGRRTAHKAA